MAPKNKTKQIGVRVTVAEKQLFERWAAYLNLRISDYVRLCVLNDIYSRKSLLINSEKDKP